MADTLPPLGDDGRSQEPTTLPPIDPKILDDKRRRHRRWLTPEPPWRPLGGDATG